MSAVGCGPISLHTTHTSGAGLSETLFSNNSQRYDRKNTKKLHTFKWLVNMEGGPPGLMSTQSSRDEGAGEREALRYHQGGGVVGGVVVEQLGLRGGCESLDHLHPLAWWLLVPRPNKEPSRLLH